jgi:hypothetical protein
MLEDFLDLMEVRDKGDQAHLGTASCKIKHLTQVALLPDRPLLVSMSVRKVEFSGFPYVTQLSTFPAGPFLHHRLLITASPTQLVGTQHII